MENLLAKRLVDHYGGRQAAAEALGVNAETLRLWLKKKIPLERSINVEKRSRGIVTAEEILRDHKYAS